ncbi:MAG TPA: cytochrome c [Thermoanaerobaculia bacterium]|nr:cytochrome c [Thermoanaerobaculia bacterium]
MSWAIVLPALGVLVLLRLLEVASSRRARLFRVPILAWLAAWWVAVYVTVAYGFKVPIPSSIVHIYVAITTGVLAVYATSDRQRFEDVKRPLLAFLTERRFVVPLLVVILLVPAAVAAKIYRDMTAPPLPPFFGRTVHPAPPNQITVHDKIYDLTNLQNPHRELERTNPALYRQKVATGRQVYYSNCFFCHGDLLRGEGMYAHSLNPIPTNFQDPGTIAQLQESYLFWRVAKGGPGLPDEGGPWMSAMPVWEQFLDEEQIWDVILFLYDFTGNRPRAREAVEATASHEQR